MQILLGTFFFVVVCLTNVCSSIFFFSILHDDKRLSCHFLSQRREAEQLLLVSETHCIKSKMFVFALLIACAVAAPLNDDLFDNDHDDSLDDDYDILRNITGNVSVISFSNTCFFFVSVWRLFCVLETGVGEFGWQSNFVTNLHRLCSTHYPPCCAFITSNLSSSLI